MIVFDFGVTKILLNRRIIYSYYVYVNRINFIIENFIIYVFLLQMIYSKTSNLNNATVILLNIIFKYNSKNDTIHLKTYYNVNFFEK